MDLFKNDKSPQLFRLGKSETGFPWGRAAIDIMITQLVAFLGAGKDFDGFQIKEVAELAYQENSHLTIAEWKLFINRIKTGKYKKLSHKNFTPVVFMEYLNEYSLEIHEMKGNYNSYKWRDQPEELEMPIDPSTGLPGVPVSDEVFNAGMKAIIEALTVKKEETEKEETIHRDERNKAGGIRQMEFYMSCGYAPDEVLYEHYLKVKGL